MKFIRYGNLKAYRQRQYVDSPEAGQLKHAEPATWRVNRLAGRTTSRFGGPWTMNTMFDPKGMYECFFDEEDARKIT